MQSRLACNNARIHKAGLLAGMCRAGMNAGLFTGICRAGLMLLGVDAETEMCLCMHGYTD